MALRIFGDFLLLYFDELTFHPNNIRTTDYSASSITPVFCLEVKDSKLVDIRLHNQALSAHQTLDNI